MLLARSLRATLILALTLGICAPCDAQTIGLPVPIPVAAYAATLRTINPHLAVAQSITYAQTLLLYSRKWRLDPSLVMALVAVESNWNSRAVSYSGALGLGQLKPGTARELGVDPSSVHGNLRGTTLYLHRLIGVFRSARDPIREALAGYNAGPETVRVYGGIPPIYETRHYVKKVMGTWHVLRARIAARAAVERAQPANVDPTGSLAYWGVR